MNGENNNIGKLVVISGSSGVGKSTICRELVKRAGAFLCVSVTTRPKSNSEVNGRDYWFVDREQFEERNRAGEFLEYAEVFGNFYATPRDQVDRAIDDDKTVLLEIDVQGGRKIKKAYPDALMIFILPPNQDDLAERMKNRGRGEDGNTARTRLEGASRETAAAWQYYEHMVINDDLEQAIEEVVQIVKADTGETDDRRTQEH